MRILVSRTFSYGYTIDRIVGERISHSKVAASIAVAAFERVSHGSTVASKARVLIGGLRRWCDSGGRGVNRLRVHKEDRLTCAPKRTHVVRKLHEDFGTLSQHTLPECALLPFWQTWNKPHFLTQKHRILYEQITNYDKKIKK